MLSEKEELLDRLIEAAKYHKNSSLEQNTMYDSQALDIIKVAEDQDYRYGSAQGTILHAFLATRDKKLSPYDKVHLIYNMVISNDPQLLNVLTIQDNKYRSPLHLLMELPEKQMPLSSKQEVKDFFLSPQNRNNKIAVDFLNEITTIKGPQNKTFSEILDDISANNPSHRPHNQRNSIVGNLLDKIFIDSFFATLFQENKERNIHQTETLKDNKEQDNVVSTPKRQHINMGGLERINQENQQNHQENQQESNSLKSLKTKKDTSAKRPTELNNSDNQQAKTEDKQNKDKTPRKSQKRGNNGRG